MAEYGSATNRSVTVTVGGGGGGGSWPPVLRATNSDALHQALKTLQPIYAHATAAEAVTQQKTKRKPRKGKKPNMTNYDDVQTESAVTADLATMAVTRAQVVIPDATSVVSVVTKDCEGETHEFKSLEQYLPEPRRQRGFYSVTDVDGLAALTARYGGDGTVVYVDRPNLKITAVFNHDDWRDHGAVLRISTPTAYNNWESYNNSFVSQERFAMHLKVSAAQITDPSSAALQAIVNTFQSTSASSYKSHRKTRSGDVKFSYETTSEATAGEDGTVVVPETFGLELIAYTGADPAPVTAELMWRISYGEPNFGYAIADLDAAKTAGWRSITDKLVAALPKDVLIVNGVLPAGVIAM